MLVAALQASAAAIMVAAPMISSAGEIFRKDGHEITCKAATSLLSLPFAAWQRFDLTIMHGARLVYFCIGETETVNIAYEKVESLTGWYNCDRQSGSLEIWDYPSNFRVYLSEGHREAEKQVCMDFIDKHLKLLPR